VASFIASRSFCPFFPKAPRSSRAQRELLAELFHACRAGFTETSAEGHLPWYGSWAPPGAALPVIDRHTLMVVYTPQIDEAKDFFRQLRWLLEQKQVANQEVVLIEHTAACGYDPRKDGHALHHRTWNKKLNSRRLPPSINRKTAVFANCFLAPSDKGGQMRSMALFTAGGVVLLAGLTAARAADPAPADKTGLKVGTKAPAFALKDQAGKERTLDAFRQKGKVALVFYRSASW
jgi:hypothetical protein